MSDKELTKEEMAIIENLWIELLPKLVEKYDLHDLETASEKVIAALKAGFILIKTDSKQ